MCWYFWKYSSVSYLVLTNIIENVPAHIEEELMFQQDGARPHYSQNERNYLNDTFRGRLIGRRGTIERLSRSPDLSNLDFLWDTQKNRSVSYST